MRKATVTVDILIYDESELIDAARCSDSLKTTDIGEAAELIPDYDVGAALRVMIHDRPSVPGCELLKVRCDAPLH